MKMLEKPYNSMAPGALQNYHSYSGNPDFGQNFGLTAGK